MGAALLLADAAAQTSQPAATYDEPQRVCTLRDPRIAEASGLAASRRHRDCYYVHNDSGDGPYVYQIDRDGETRLRIRLSGATHLDWEDIALAPGERAGTFDVCVADIGDNAGNRPDVVVYRFPEPEHAGPADETLAVGVTRYRMTYPDGPHDAEGFAVDPHTGDGYIFTKRFDGRCDVYRAAAPWEARGTTKLTRAGALRFPRALPLATMVTGADISPDARRLVVRSMLCGWEWTLPGDASADGFRPVFTREGTRITLAVETQGEAIGYSADGMALLTVSEKRPTELYEVRRATLDD